MEPCVPSGINDLLPGTPYMATTFQPDTPRNRGGNDAPHMSPVAGGTTTSSSSSHDHEAEVDRHGGDHRRRPRTTTVVSGAAADGTVGRTRARPRSHVPEPEKDIP